MSLWKTTFSCVISFDLMGHTNEAAIDYSPIVEYILICFTDYVL